MYLRVSRRAQILSHVSILDLWYERINYRKGIQATPLLIYPLTLPLALLKMIPQNFKTDFSIQLTIPKHTLSHFMGVPGRALIPAMLNQSMHSFHLFLV